MSARTWDQVRDTCVHVIRPNVSLRFWKTQVWLLCGVLSVAAIVKKQLLMVETQTDLFGGFWQLEGILRVLVQLRANFLQLLQL